MASLKGLKVNLMDPEGLHPSAPPQAEKPTLKPDQEARLKEYLATRQKQKIEEHRG